MSETHETHETPAERRLREMITEWRDYAEGLERAGHVTRADAWSDAATELEQEIPALLARDAGREALALLREWVRGDYGFPDEDCRRFTEDARALLARCGEDA